MEKELYRLATFSSWPDTSDFSPLPLAKNGFFFTGFGDKVECFACKVHLSQLRADQNLNERHIQSSPTCAFVRGNDTGNCPLKPPCVDERSVTISEASIDNAEEVSDAQALKNVCKLAVKRAISKHLFFTSACYIIDHSQPDYEKLRYEQVRLSTYHDWPSGAQADPRSLATEGLFYTGSGDRVQCAFCRGLMKNWKHTDIPSVEHRRHFPDCHFVQSKEVGNVPIAEQRHTENSLKTGNNTCSFREVEVQNSTTDIHQRSAQQHSISVLASNPADIPLCPEYSDISKRIQSFVGGIVSPGQTAEGLADAGFFYIGPDDKVKCFHCAGNLRSWEPEDNPWEQHRIWYGTCSYVKTHQPAQRQHIQQVPPHQQRAAITGTYHVEPREVKARMDTRTVQAILDMGYARDFVKMAIESHLTATGDDFPNAESLLEALFQLEEAATVSCNSSILQALRPPSTDVLTKSAVVASPMTGGISQPSFVPSLGLSDDAANVPFLLAPVAMPMTEKKRKIKKKKPSAASNVTNNEEEQKTVLVNCHQNNPVSTTPKTDPKSEEASFVDEPVEYAEENRQLRDARTCKVCMDAEVDTVFLPCGHLACCSNCSPQMQNCCICRTRIQGTVKTFLS